MSVSSHRADSHQKPRTGRESVPVIVHKSVNLVFVGAGPATLGILNNAQKNNK